MFPAYRAGKLQRGERLGNYFRVHELDPSVAEVVNTFIVNRLVAEHPQAFTFERGVLSCRLTGERLTFGDGMRLCGADTSDRVEPPHVSAFDVLASQVQEDLAVISSDGARHWLVPRSTSRSRTLGGGGQDRRTFPTIHQPVAGMEADESSGATSWSDDDGRDGGTRPPRVGR